MKTLLTTLAFRRQIGLAIGEREVAMCRVAATPMGPVEVSRRREPIEGDQVGAAVERLLAAEVSPRELARTSVVVGLPERRVFFSTRPIQSDNRDASPEVLLHEVLQSPTINIDDMVVDLVKAQPGKRPLASIASCRKKYLAAVLSGLEGCGVRPMRVEPIPCGLLRVAAQRHRSPRKSKYLVRVFLGRDRGLAVLTAGDLPLLWRSFDLPDGGEATAVLATIASVRILGQYCGTDSDADAVMIHGRPDLAISASPGESGSPTGGLKVVRCDGPALDDGAAASGLVAGLGPNEEAFNLVRSFGQSASIREIFPWAETALQVALLLLATTLLLVRLRGQVALTEGVQAEDAKHTWAASTPAEKLAKQKGDLEQRLGAVQKFLDSRIAWTTYGRELARKVSPEVLVTSFRGLNDLELQGGKGPKARPKKSLVLKLATPVSDDGAIPKEVGVAVAALREDELLRRDFPDIDMTDLQSAESPGRRSEARFTLICLPSPDAGKAKGAGAGDAKAKGGKSGEKKPGAEKPRARAGQGKG